MRNHSDSPSPAFCEGLLTFELQSLTPTGTLRPLVDGLVCCPQPPGEGGEVQTSVMLSDTLDSWALLSLRGKLAGKRSSLTSPRQEAAQYFSLVKVFFTAHCYKPKGLKTEVRGCRLDWMKLLQMVHRQRKGKVLSAS